MRGEIPFCALVTVNCWNGSLRRLVGSGKLPSCFPPWSFPSPGKPTHGGPGDPWDAAHLVLLSARGTKTGSTHGSSFGGNQQHQQNNS